MKYSIIIPVYNTENKLPRCLDSILNQDYGDYEILLINDGSSDGSASICEEYAKRFSNILYINKENGGASSARNAGLEKASGDYILFVDSDDYVDERYFSLLEGREEKNGLAVFTYAVINSHGKRIRPVPEQLLSDTDMFTKTELLISSRTINSLYAKIFYRELLESCQLRFDEKMPVAEDFNFCVSYLLKCNSVKVINEAVYCYDNTNESSLVKKRKKGLIDIYPYVFDTVFEHISESDFSEEQKLKLFRIWDKLHTDSFATCVMEELKDESMTPKEIKSEIRDMCKKYYERYCADYGYYNIVHFAVRFCIKHKFKNTLYYISKFYLNHRG